MELDQQQQEAVAAAVSGQFAIINGGAGTGKTTIISSICDVLEKQRRPFRLCAFAGKAAARMRDATGRSASTIHSMLRWQGDAGFTLRSLDGERVILDEASMVPSWLLAEIIKRRPDGMILVGDESQLPPVGAGQPFHDLVRHGCNGRVRTLLTCYRNKAAINVAAAAIRVGQLPPGSMESDGERFRMIGVDGPTGAHAWLLDAVQRGDIDFSKDIVICPCNGSENTPATIESLNRDIAAMVIPREEHKIVEGDRVINTKNVAQKDIWNGTTGVAKFDSENCVWFHLDTPTESGETAVLLDKKEAKALAHAYALTVHKSQGSQYRRVYFVCLSRDTFRLLDRAMLYTGVTRARIECVVLTDRSALRTALSNRSHRNTYLQTLIGAA